MVKKLTRSLAPTYFYEFQCIGSACEDTCCAGWNISIDKKTYKSYKNEKNILLKDLFKKNIVRNKHTKHPEFDYGKFEMDSEHKCTMLTEDHLCSIQNILGEKALCHTCTIYPRKKYILNGTLEKSLDTSCPEASRKILLRPEGIDFIEEECMEDLNNIQSLSLPENYLTLFWQLRIFMIDTLQNRNHPLEVRLLVISMLLQSLSTSTNLSSQDIEKTINKYNLYLNNPNLKEEFHVIEKLYKEQLHLGKMILTLSRSERYNILRKKILTAIDFSTPDSLSQDYELYYEPFIQKYEYILENYLVNAVFTNIKSPNLKDMLNHFATICIDFSMIRLFITGYFKSENNYSIEGAIHCIQQYSKNLAHSIAFSDYLNDLLKEDLETIILKITSLVHK